MSGPEHVELDDWSELEEDLRQRLKARKFTRMIMYRNFNAARLAVALSTGTDRDRQSKLCFEKEFDYDHTAHPSGKGPDEVVYVHRVNPHTRPFTVLNLGGEYTEIQEDLTEQLCENDAVSIYDSAGLKRAAFNEHWFIAPPLSSLLYVYTLREQEEEGN